MKIYRSGKTSKKWGKPTAKTGNNWAKKWQPGMVKGMDATIDKSGERHTDVGVELEPDDIVELAAALFAHQKTRIANLEAQLTRMKEAMDKLRVLATNRDYFVEDSDLIRSVGVIAEHYRKRSGTPAAGPRLDGVRWKDIVSYRML